MIYILFAGKDLRDPRVITNVGDIPIEEIRDCGVDDKRLANVITESVKLVMDEVYNFVALCF
jgi:arginase